MAVLAIALLFSQARGQDDTDLAKKTQNPVADLIRVPFQNNWNFNAGVQHNKRIYVLNIQPVIPIELIDEWNLISRIIMPVIDQHALSPISDRAFGLGDINPPFFFSPAKPGKVI